MSMKTNTLYTTTFYTATTSMQSYVAFQTLLLNLQQLAEQTEETILWDTLKIGSERNEIETGSLVQPYVESYMIWTAQVTTVREVEE